MRSSAAALRDRATRYFVAPREPPPAAGITDLSPGADITRLVPRAPAPDADTPRLLARGRAPGSDTPRPIARGRAPGSDTPRPIARGRAPGSDTPRPLPGGPAWGANVTPLVPHSPAAGDESAQSAAHVGLAAGAIEPPRFPPRAAVLGSAADAPPVAAALANALRARHGASAAVVAVWAPARVGTAPPDTTAVGEARSGPPATPAASTLAARLRARGLEATCRGRLAWLRLADHPVAAALAARRLAGALEVPLVLALGGPRVDAFEDLLREQDLVVVVAPEPDGPLARLAVAGCEAPAIACEPLGPGPSRLLARAGLAGARTLAEPLRAAVRRLGEPPAAWASPGVTGRRRP